MTVQLSRLSAPSLDHEILVARLRAAGCVFAEEEAAILHEAACGEGQLESFTRRRETGEPLEPIVGWVAFGRLRLAVGQGVFVPRQRSRLLADTAARWAIGQTSPVVLEAFCGVAPIAATVYRAKAPIEVHLTDIDREALGYARRNVPDATGIYCGDGLDPLPASLLRRVTLLVATPPYVPSTAADLLPREAREYEPARALFAGTDGLFHIRSLISEAMPWLAPDSAVLIEMNKSQLASSAAFARAAGFVSRQRIGREGQTAMLGLRRRADLGTGVGARGRTLGHTLRA